MTRRDLARVLVEDMSRDLMDLTAILSYERDTNYVIKDKMNDIYTCALACTHHSDLSREISFHAFEGNFYTYIQVLFEDSRFKRLRNDFMNVLRLKLKNLIKL